MKYEERVITFEEYQYLRKSVGWWDVDQASIQAALASSICSIAVTSQDRIIGMGRVIGDGLYYYVQDIVVHPAHQAKGIGHKIMGMLIQYINTAAPKGSFIGLMAAKGLEKFYEEFGFQKRPDDAPGMYYVKQ